MEDTNNNILNKDNLDDLSKKLNDNMPGCMSLIKAVLVLSIIFLIIPYAVMQLWNALIPDLFKGPEITYVQSIMLYIICIFLFKSPNLLNNK